MSTLLSQIAPRLREFWVSPPTQDAVEEAGAFCSTLRKGPTTAIGGDMYWSGDGVGELALRIGGSGNVGSNRGNDVRSIAKSEDNVRYTPLAASYWSIFDMDSDDLRLVLQEDVSADQGASLLMQSMTRTMRNFYRSVSSYGWRDGRGGVASLAAGSATGTTITLSNPDMVRAFEVGDVIVAYDPAVYLATAIGVPAAPRGTPALPATDVVTVTGRDEDLGTLTLGAAFSTITGGAAADIIGHFQWRPRSGASRNTGLYGVSTYLAFSTADRTATALGIDRSVDPGRIAGRFIALPSGTPATAVLEEIGTACGRFNIRPDMVYAPNRVWTDLARDRTSKSRYVQTSTMEFGATGVEVIFPNSSAMLTTDAYLWDLQSNDDIYVALQSQDWGYVTTREGLGWDMLGRAGSEGGLHSLDNTTVTANYGAVGQIACSNPSKAIVVRVPR